MTATYNLQRELSHRGHRVTVLTTLLGDHDSPKHIVRSVEGMTVHYFRGYFEGMYFSHHLLRFLLAEPRYDIVHINNYRNFPSDLVLLWARRRRIPAVMSANGSLYSYRHIQRFPIIKRFLYNLHDLIAAESFRRVNMALAVSSAEASQYKEFGIPQSKVRLVPNGVNTLTFCPGQSNNAILSQMARGSKIVGFVGRLDRVKGLVPLIRAFALVSQKIPESKLVIIGPDFGMKKMLSAIIRSQKISRIVFFNTLPYEELVQAYRAFDVVVVPSIFEVFGMSALEAMACGKPVVATRVGGLVDLISDGVTGLLVPPDDHTVLAAQIVQVLQDTSRATTLGKNARVRAEEYAIDRIAELTETAYVECISDFPSP